MRKSKMGLVALAASAVMLVLAGSAAATTQSTSNAPLSSSSTCLWGSLGCFDLQMPNDIIVSDDVDLWTAAIWCGVSPGVLAALSIGQIYYCPTPPFPQRTVKRVA